jgi:hypothetical protein
VAANLAQFHPKWGFAIKTLQWKYSSRGIGLPHPKAPFEVLETEPSLGGNILLREKTSFLLQLVGCINYCILGHFYTMLSY